MIKPLKYQYFIETAEMLFTDEQITKYIVKYIEIHEYSSTIEEYEEYLNKVPGLKFLIKTPFLLMVAMYVMPRLLQQYELDKNKHTTITKAQLFDEFIQQLFENEEDQLMIEGKLPTDGRDVKEDFWVFAMELAVAMYEAGIDTVYYDSQDASLYDNKSTNPWKKFFGLPTDSKKAENLIRARNGCSCVLKTIAKDRYSFIHASLQDYFVIKKIQLDEEQTATTRVMSNKPFAPFYSSLVNSDFIEQPLDIAPKTLSSIKFKARV